MTKRVMGSVRAELLKMKHTFLIPFHVAVPVIIAGFMLFYYRGTIGNPMGQTMAYFELIGIGLPFVVSIVCAGNIGLEEQNHFQVFLGNYKVKGKGFVVKGVVLFGMGFLAIFGAAVLFAAGYHFLLGKEGIGMRYVRLTGTLIFGSVPLYLEHLFLNLIFPKTVSQCVGVAQSVVSALFLTGLGEGRWQFFPATWSARGIRYCNDPVNGKRVLFCLLLLFLMCVIIGVWFHKYEGSAMTEILAIDDDREILAVIKKALLREGYQVTALEDPLQLEEDKLGRYQLILLDVMMPGIDGFDLCRRIREKVDCPILFLTAKTEEKDVMTGLGAGGDDYITKPFGIGELRARVAAHIRRENREKTHTICIGEVRFSMQERKIYVQEHELVFTKAEYTICEFLALNHGQVFSKERILEHVFGFDGDSNSSAITEHVKNIRAKFQKFGINPIETVWGIGYRWK